MTTMDEIFAGHERRNAILATNTNPFARGIAWIADELVPYHDARIPLRDQGFLHSDLTYDVPAIWDGRFFRLDDHLDRLEASCKKIRLQLPKPKQQIKAILFQMAAMSGIRDAFVELIITRGFKGVRESRPEEIVNNMYLFIIPYVWVMEPAVQRTGGSAVIARTVRRVPPGAIDPTVKNLQWGDLTRAMQEARDRGALYPFLTDGDAHLTEGSGFNIVFIKDNVLYTPDRGILHGITRKSVFDAARVCGVEVRCEVVPVALAYEADEILMCTTAGGIMPITTLDGEKVKDGLIGPVTKKIWDVYWAMHWDPVYSVEIDYDASKSRL
jgi:branched-subunit amino acid aminotransferase/4-amino-4-deoxychorismate lyase